MKKKKKIIRHITYDLKFSSDYSDESDEDKLNMIMGSYFKKGKFISVKGFSLKRERKSMVYFLENIFPILYNTAIFLVFKKKQNINLIPKEFYSIFMQYITTTYSAI